MMKILLGGPVDPVFGSIAVAIMFIMIGVYLTNLLYRRRSSVEIANEHELAVIKLRDARELAERDQERKQQYELVKLENERAVNIRRIETSVGMVDVSPRPDNSGGEG